MQPIRGTFLGCSACTGSDHTAPSAIRKSRRCMPHAPSRPRDQPTTHRIPSTLRLTRCENREPKLSDSAHPHAQSETGQHHKIEENDSALPTKAEVFRRPCPTKAKAPRGGGALIVAGMRCIELNWLVVKQPIRLPSSNLGWDPASRAEPCLRPLDLMREDRDRNLPPHQIDLNTDSAVGSKLFNHAWRPAADQIVGEAN